MGLIDELHEHPNPDTVNKIRAGAKGNLDALFPEITNSGSDRTSICFQHHEHSRHILDGTVEDDRWFAYVCALGPGDDPLVDEACHIKANPNLGVSIQREYLADQVSAARNIPGETNTVLRLNFCVWTQQHTRAIDMAAWFECAPPPPDAELVGVPCYGGLDLGMSDDFTAWVRVWTLDDGRVVVKCRFWLPSAALTKYPHRPYAQWQRRGLLTVTEGLTTDYDTVEATVGADCHRDGIRSVAYDKRFAEQLAQHLIGDGVDMIDQPQGFQLTEAIRRKGELVAARTLCHGGDEILAWMAANYVIRHGLRGDTRPDKDKAADKIDGQVALDMALAIWIRQPSSAPPAYQMIVFGGTP
jgi:phage terminase large subunit-like protein